METNPYFSPSCSLWNSGSLDVSNQSQASCRHHQCQSSLRQNCRAIHDQMHANSSTHVGQQLSCVYSLSMHYVYSLIHSTSFVSIIYTHPKYNSFKTLLHVKKICTLKCLTNAVTGFHSLFKLTLLIRFFFFVIMAD